MAQGGVRAGLVATRGEHPAGVSGFVVSVRARPGGEPAGHPPAPRHRAGCGDRTRRPDRAEAASRDRAARSQAADPIVPAGSRPVIVLFAVFTPCTPLPARCRSGTAPVLRLASVAQGQAFTQLSRRGKPIIVDSGSLSAIMISSLSDHCRNFVAVRNTYTPIEFDYSADNRHNKREYMQ